MPSLANQILTQRIAFAPIQTVCAAACALFAAVRRGHALVRFFIFTHQELLADAIIHMIPGKHLVKRAAAVGIKQRVNPALLKRLLPEVKMKLVIPAVKFAALAPRAFEHFSEAPVAARKHTLQEARLHIVAADFDLAGGA